VRHTIITVSKNIISPKILNQKEGSDVLFFCKSKFKSHWFWENSYVPLNMKFMHVQSKDDILVINNVTINNSGNYECRVEDTKFLVHRDYSTLIVERK